MANYKFAINTTTKRLLRQLLTWDDANVKRSCKTSRTTVFRQLSNSPWTRLWMAKSCTNGDDCHPLSQRIPTNGMQPALTRHGSLRSPCACRNGRYPRILAPPECARRHSEPAYDLRLYIVHSIAHVRPHSRLGRIGITSDERIGQLPVPLRRHAMVRG